MNAQRHMAAKTTTAAPVASLPARRGVLQRKCACGGTAGPSGECGTCRRGRMLQPRLRVGQPDDRYEREAERIAEKVMHMPAPAGAEQSSQPGSPIGRITSFPQHQTVLAEGKAQAQAGQVKPAPGAVPEGSVDTSSELASLRGRGQPLSESDQAFFKARFGHEFSRVRVHADGKAERLAHKLQARAFTLGHDVVFGAGQYAPRTAAGRRLLAHELTHVVQQQGGRRLLQRRTDQVISLPVRPNAQACLVHLHGDESNALRAAREVYNGFCTNLVYIDHPGRRRIRVDVPGHAGVSCQADPNRIFDDAAIRTQWANWNAGSCLRDPVKSAGIGAVSAYRDTELNPLIRQCRGQGAAAGTQGAIQGSGVAGDLPIIAFHNNRPVSPGARTVRRGGRCIEDLTIRSYLPGHCEAAATETDTGRTRNLSNPNIVVGEDIDNFFLVTDPLEFRALRTSRNVVLQKLNLLNDGSLSVVLQTGEHYINVEAERGRANLAANRALAAAARVALDVDQLPCPDSAGGQPSSTAPTTGTPVTGTRPARGQITSASVRRLSNQDLDRFMRRVYDLQVQLWTSQGVTFTGSVPASQLARLPSRDVLPGRRVQVHREIASAVRTMLADARSDVIAQAPAVSDIRVRSGYRAARQQLLIWGREYPGYYQQTRLRRRMLAGGEHGDAAARFLASYINERVFSPGFSPHQQGRAIDLTYLESGTWAEASTSPAWMSTWRSSRLFNWLRIHAPGYGFVQNPGINEPWHWEYRPVAALAIILFRLIRAQLVTIIDALQHLWQGEEAARPSRSGPGQEESASPSPPGVDR